MTPDDLITVYDRWGVRCRVSLSEAQRAVRLDKLIPLYNQYGRRLSWNNRRLRSGTPTHLHPANIAPVRFNPV